MSLVTVELFPLGQQRDSRHGALPHKHGIQLAAEHSPNAAPIVVLAAPGTPCGSVLKTQFQFYGYPAAARSPCCLLLPLAFDFP